MNKVILTVDLGFGDAGKGAIVDFLVRERGAHTVVRYNGGAQAGHRVVTPDGREHVFSQFGAGTLAGARTHLARFMLLDPLAMLAEAEHLQQLGVAAVFDLVTIDEQALVITPFQRAINRLKELSRSQRHGSCGMGIGETMVDKLTHGEAVLLAGDLAEPDRLREKLLFVRAINRAKLAEIDQARLASEAAQAELAVLWEDDWIDWLVEDFGRFFANAHIVPSTHLHTILNQPGTVIFEGAQGVLLDEWYGFHPHTTWSTITFANADTLLQEANYQGHVERVGITRAYSTRHGAGPFVSEDAELTRTIPDAVNGFDAWQEGFRVGWLDLVMLKYAVDVVGELDYLAVTCLDRLQDEAQLFVCDRYVWDTVQIDRLQVKDKLEDLDFQARMTALLGQVRPKFTLIPDLTQLLKHIAAATNLPIGITSYGASATDKQQLARKNTPLELSRA